MSASIASTPMTEWKQVPPECVHGITTLYATKDGQVRNGERLLRRSKGPKGKDGYYICCVVNKHTLYFHRLVYFAHSGKSPAELLAGSVIFREVADPSTILDERGCYRSWFEDVVFIPSPHTVSDTLIPAEVQVAEHPRYGAVRFNEWRPLCTLPRGEARLPVKSDIYEICLLNNPEIPCLIRNKSRGIILNLRTNKGHDPAVGLKPSTTEASINYQLTHILLASAFPTETALYTADHMNDDSKNNCVLNLQWMTSIENCRKAQSKTAEKRRAATAAGRKPREPIVNLPDEIWKPLPLTDHTLKTYAVSNRGRVKNISFINPKRKKIANITGRLLNPKPIRGRKYTAHTVATDINKHKTFNTHYLVYKTFYGEVPDGMDILHNDFAPLNPDGTYRNWAEDFTLGSRGTNVTEYHAARRVGAMSATTPTTATSDSVDSADSLKDAAETIEHV